MNHAALQYLTTDYLYRKQCDNFVAGQWVKPAGGE